MSLDGDYDQNNIFARILRGEIPCAKILEDDQTLAIMDAFPQSHGHCLVLPKYPARNLLELPSEEIGPLMRMVQRLAKAVRAALVPDGLLISQFNGAPAGQTVFHLHVHIIPRYPGQPLGRHGAGSQADLAGLERLAAQIRAKLQD